MNLGISNHYQYGPAFGAAKCSKKGLQKTLNSIPYRMYGETKNDILAAKQRAETSKNADLIIKDSGRVYVGCKDGEFRKPAGGFTELEGNIYKCPLVDKKNRPYTIEFKFDNQKDAEALNGQIYAGQHIDWQTVKLFNTIEDGVEYKITPDSK